MPDRLFVAIWPNSAARAALHDTVSEARAEHPSIRWQPDDRWHLTMAFLEAADYDRTQERIGRVELPAAEPIRLRGAGVFGPIIWIGVEHGAWLAELAGRLQRALRTPDRRFTGHVTVGRARGSHAVAQARAARGALADHAGPSWLPDEVTLVQSRTGPTPRYTVRARWPLAR